MGSSNSCLTKVIINLLLLCIRTLLDDCIFLKIKEYYFKHLDKNVKIIDLSYNKLKTDDINFEYFKKSKFPKLEKLILTGNAIDFDVLKSDIATFEKDSEVKVVRWDGDDRKMGN